jgi:hypothetical protein
MKLTSIAVVVLAARGAQAGQFDSGTVRDLTIYTDGEGTVPFRTRALAERTASEIFGRIGVRVIWRHRIPAAGQVRREQAMVVRFLADSADQPDGGAIASASPYEGSTITILYGRMKWAENRPRLAPRLLAHVVVHEIAHNLQGIARHSETGIMKARWTAADYSSMSMGPLAFKPYDIELIHQGLKARAALLEEDRSPSTRDFCAGRR